MDVVEVNLLGALVVVVEVDDGFDVAALDEPLALAAMPLALLAPLPPMETSCFVLD